MSSQHLSVRVDAATLDRLDQESRRLGESRSQVAKRFLEEGLRMSAHPGIVFRPGPAGRRPGLAAGPDVWEVISLFQEFEAPREDAIRRTAEWSSLTSQQVRVALSYYAEFPDEIDNWIQRNDEEAHIAKARWRREQALLGS